MTWWDNGRIVFAKGHKIMKRSKNDFGKGWTPGGYL
jgi:hypothetical protein